MINDSNKESLSLIGHNAPSPPHLASDKNTSSSVGSPGKNLTVETSSSRNLSFQERGGLPVAKADMLQCQFQYLTVRPCRSDIPCHAKLLYNLWQLIRSCANPHHAHMRAQSRSHLLPVLR